jgi:hypothetical protein
MTKQNVRPAFSVLKEDTGAIENLPAKMQVTYALIFCLR